MQFVAIDASVASPQKKEHSPVPIRTIAGKLQNSTLAYAFPEPMFVAPRSQIRIKPLVETLLGNRWDGVALFVIEQAEACRFVVKFVDR